MRSTRLAVVPGWVGELTRLEALEVSGVVSGVDYEERNSALRALPASLGQLGALKQLTLAGLDGLEVLPDAVVRLTSLGSLTIDDCGNLRALPRALGKLGALKQLFVGLVELQEIPDLIGLTALGRLTIQYCYKLKTLPRGLGELGALKQLTLLGLHELQEMPDLIGLTAMGSLTIEDCYKLKTLPKGLGELGALKQLTLGDLHELQEMPDLIGLTAMDSLTIYGCNKLKTLPRGLGKLGALKQLTLARLSELQEVPDLIGLSALGSLTIQYCSKLKKLPRGLGKLGALKQLTLVELPELQEVPDLIGLTALGSLTIHFHKNCYRLKTLPRGLGELGALKQLTLRGRYIEMPDLIGLTALGSLKFECGSKLPCIEALTALHELCLHVADYAQRSRAFTALSRSLPCLQQLQVLRLRASGEDDDGDDFQVALQARDVLAIGRALKAWPLPLLHVVDFYDDDDNELSEEEHADAEEKMRLSTCWRALGLPAAAADWTNAMTLDYFRVQQQKVAAFASGMHARLGAASGVSCLDEQALVMIADEVLGGWGLLKEWRRVDEKRQILFGKIS